MPVYGTRPEAIKMAPVISALQQHPLLETHVAVTGQHRAMLDQVNSLFGIVPDHDLDIFATGQTLDGVTASTLGRLGPVLDEVQPHLVLVQGDTTSAFASGLAAFYRKIPVVHVEAGLRTDDMLNPFPEEMNRRLVGRIASLHLAPTQESRGNLEREGIDPRSIVVTGNTVIDALQATVQKGARFVDPAVQAVVDSSATVVLVTAHRRESWGEPLRDVGRALRSLAARFPDVRWVLPLHANPLVRDAIVPEISGSPSVVLTEPLDYDQFCTLMARSELVLTDSGGVQEEAPSLGRPVLVLRENTERPEAVTAGTVRLVGTDPALIESEVVRLLTDPEAYAEMARAVNPYGDGLAAERSVAAIAEHLGIGTRLPDFSPV